MPFSDVGSRIEILGDFPDVELVHNTIKSIYDGSKLIQTALKKWLIQHPTENLKIEFRSSTARGLINQGIILIDPLFFLSNFYISDHGNVAVDTFMSGLVHELGHAITGNGDNDYFTDLAGDNFTDLAGDNLDYGDRITVTVYLSPALLHKQCKATANRLSPA
jgi:hypothetical protein